MKAIVKCGQLLVLIAMVLGYFINISEANGIWFTAETVQNLDGKL